MREEAVRRLLEQVAAGSIDVSDAVSRLKDGPLQGGTTESATPDSHREFRLGLAEVVYGEHKTTEQILEIVARLNEGDTPLLVTRLDESKQRMLRGRFADARLNPVARTLLVHAPPSKGSSSGEPFVALVSAGTGDLPVVEEAAEVCVAMDVAFEKVVDVGVAGLHRVIDHLPMLRRAVAVVVVAGMDGVLPSVLGGLLDRQLISVPTSVGYGALFGGIAPLLTMLNSCAPGVTVTNIDNGFSAAVAACRIARDVRDQTPADPPRQVAYPEGDVENVR